MANISAKQWHFQDDQTNFGGCTINKQKHFY